MVEIRYCKNTRHLTSSPADCLASCGCSYHFILGWVAKAEIDVRRENTGPRVLPEASGERICWLCLSVPYPVSPNLGAPPHEPEYKRSSMFAWTMFLCKLAVAGLAKVAKDNRSLSDQFEFCKCVLVVAITDRLPPYVGQMKVTSDVPQFGTVLYLLCRSQFN